MARETTNLTDNVIAKDKSTEQPTEERLENDTCALNYKKSLDDVLNRVVPTIDFSRLCDRIESSVTLFFAGAGGSNFTAMHMAAGFRENIGKATIALPPTKVYDNAKFGSQFVRHLIDGKFQCLIVYDVSGDSETILDIVGSALALNIAVIAFSGRKDCKLHKACRNYEYNHATSINLGIDDHNTEGNEVAEDAFMVLTHMLMKKYYYGQDVGVFSDPSTVLHEY